MKYVTVQLDCFGGPPPPATPAPGFDYQMATATVDLRAPQPFMAWCMVGYVNGLGPWGQRTSIAADVWRVDNSDLPATAWGGGNLLGNAGSWANLRPMFYVGSGQLILFRLRVSHAVNMEAAALGIVLYDL